MTEISEILSSVKVYEDGNRLVPGLVDNLKMPFDGDGVIIEGVISEKSKDGESFSMISPDDDKIWSIRISDVVDIRKSDSSEESQDGVKCEVKVRLGSVVREEKRLIIGQEIVGSSDFEEEVSIAAPPSGCKCARRCRRGWCCAQHGWVYVCRRSSCVLSDPPRRC